MRLPVMHGLIERRMLVNYRVDPDVLAAQLPAPFEPLVHRGSALVGICLIRLSGVRPGFVPNWFGLRSENAAHRAAVQWTDAAGTRRAGVYIRRRDTNSRLNTLFGGRLFPGVHHHAKFDVAETDATFALDMHADDGATNIAVRARIADDWPQDSIFASRQEASDFYAAGALGYSATHDPQSFDGLELRCRTWNVEALAVDEVRSNYFDDESIFPRGTITFDNALLMRNIAHEWHGREALCCSATPPLAVAAR